MKIEEAIIDAQRRNCFRRYAIMSDGHGKTTDQQPNRRVRHRSTTTRHRRSNQTL